MTIKLSLGVQFFSVCNKKDRQLLERVTIEFREQNYYKIRKDAFKKTASRKIMTSNIRGSLSIDDMLLFRGITEAITEG